MPADREYDAIVIGSGIGALAFASIMARLRQWRVLVLERHFKIGGFTHTFTRPGGWRWDVGLHYVGEMGEGMTGRRLFDFITDGGVAWNPLPDVYDVFAYPDLEVRACKGRRISGARWWRLFRTNAPTWTAICATSNPRRAGARGASWPWRRHLR